MLTKLQLFLFLVVCGAILTGSCARKPREKKIVSEGLQPKSAHSETAKPANAGLEFTAPNGWIKETPSSSSRKYQYKLPRIAQDQADAELVIYYFAGGGGTPQANIERWLSQFTSKDGKPSSQSKVSHKTVNGIPLSIVDASGGYSSSMGAMQSSAPQPDYRMLGAIAETKNGPWFIKLTGPEKTVGKWESSFYSFLDSMKETE